MSEIIKTNNSAFEKVRIFTAIMVPKMSSYDFLSLPRDGVQGRWNHPDDLHITLRFIGDIEPEKIPLIKEDLMRVKRPAIDIDIDGLDIFMNTRQPILFADVKSRRKLETLVADITDILSPYGIYIPERPYKPHVTLARLKKTPPKAIDTYIKRYSRKIKAHFKASEFHLIRSNPPNDKGAVYTSLETYKLAH